MKYIPQAAPFEMIDEVVSVTGTETQTRFTVREGHLFVEDGLFTEPGLIENMAQTAAAGTGWKAAQEGAPAPVGFIGAVKSLEVTRLPQVGDTIESEIRVQHQVWNAHIVQGSVRLNGAVIAAAEFKIFLQ